MAQAAKNEINPNDAPTEVATATGAADRPAVAVVFRNGKETPRGAWFPADDIEAVLAGAAEMGMHAVKASTAEIISLAQRLPKGRIFDSGKLFTPLIQGKVYDELMTHVPEHGITAKPRLVMSAASSGTGDADSEGLAHQCPKARVRRTGRRSLWGRWFWPRKRDRRAGSNPSCWRPDREMFSFCGTVTTPMIRS